MDINKDITTTTSDAIMFFDALQLLSKKILKAQLEKIESLNINDYEDTAARATLFSNLKVQRNRVIAKLNEL